MKQTVNQWKKEFVKGVWLWIGLSLPVFVVARLFAWEIIGHRLVTAFHLENASDLITSLIGAVLLIAIVAAMAWYFRRSFDRYFEQGYAQLLSQVETERDSHLNLLEGMPAMTWRADESGKRLYCNQRWLEFTGRDAVGSSGEEWLSIIHDEDRPTYYSKTQKSMAAGHTFSMEYRARRYDGQYRWIREHDRPLRDAHGQLRGYVGVCFDITEEQQTIHRLKESEERFRAMIESTPDGVIAHREGRIIFLNQTMCTLLGIPGEKEAIGESVLKFVASEQHALVTERIQRRIAGETHFPPMELQLVRFDGSQIDSEITATVVGMDGQPAILVFVRDISERKHVDQRLAEEAIRRRILIEGSRDGIVVLREDGSVYESNQSFADLLGYTLEEIGHQHVWDWDLTWSAEELRESLREADAEGRFFETRSLRKDGSFIDVEISTNAADWNGQKLIFCTCRDISQRKRAELSLRESERVLASLMNNLPGMAFRRKLHPERALEFASGGSWRVFGYSPEELIQAANSGDQPAIHPDDVEVVETAREQSVTSTQSLNVSYRVQHKDGTFRWVTEKASPTYAEHGREVYLEGIVYDEDERFQLQLRHSLLSAAIEAADEAIVVTDPEGVIEYVNPAFSRVTGYSREEAIGRRPSILKSGKLNGEFYASLWTTISTGQIWRGELINVARDGHEFVERATISPVLNSQGRISHYVAVKHDMTSQRNLELQLLQSQKLEAVGILAGGIAHDFNNLLTVILGHSHMLLRRIPETDPHRDDVEQILETGNRAASLTRQLLAYSRKQISRPQSVNVNQIIDNFRKMLTRILDENIVLTTELDREIPNVVIDPAHLEQVILNLVVNARDAMPQGGGIKLETRWVRSSEPLEKNSSGHVQLNCSDTGCGMDQATMDRVFDPFFTTKEVGKGTGLGLSTVYGIVHQADGAITVKSVVGEGTTFEIWLPAEAAHEQVDRDFVADPQIRQNRRGKIICLVEDESAIRQLLGRVLEQSGHRVIQASSGEEAIEILRLHEIAPEILITDVIMPGMNGRQLGEVVRKKYPECRAIYMSGYTDDVLGRNGVIDESYELLQKPFEPKDLLAAIDKIVE